MSTKIASASSFKVALPRPPGLLCSHPRLMGQKCTTCAQKINVDKSYYVRLGYINRDLMLSKKEFNRLCAAVKTYLLEHKKLYLVLDLDHTLLNSAYLEDITQEEQKYCASETYAGKDRMFRFDCINMCTKLRPFVHTFLKEASQLFELYIYTMGNRVYAQLMAKLLDPEGIYFNNLRMITQGDVDVSDTQRGQKSLDALFGQESAVVILDDTASVWAQHEDNLIVIGRYHFFASSCKKFGSNCKSLSQLQCEESEVHGSLATILNKLKLIHREFFDPGLGNISLFDRDVRHALKRARNRVLKGCKLVFSRVFPTANFQAENHQLWIMAEQLGAICTKELDPSVTHVVSLEPGTEKSLWAVQQKKFLVHPRWIEAAYTLWVKPLEDSFPVLGI